MKTLSNIPNTNKPKTMYTQKEENQERKATMYPITEDMKDLSKESLHHYLQEPDCKEKESHCLTESGYILVLAPSEDGFVYLRGRSPLDGQ